MDEFQNEMIIPQK